MSIQDGDILSVLQKATTAAVGQTSFPAVAVKYVGRSWTPPNDQKWLEIVFIPNNSDGFWGNEMDYQGMYRLILHWPNNDEGAYAPMAVLRSICSYFTKDLHLNGVKIAGTPTLNSAIVQGDEALYAASLRYSAFRQGT